VGAWGTGIFDDDSAYDCADEIAADPLGFFRRAFEVAIAHHHVGFDEGHAVAVSAAHIDAVLHGTAYRHDDQAAFDAWVANHASLAVASLKPLAVQALDAVLDDSELDDLWSQTANHAEWRRTLSGLRARLAVGC
jgi:hypothetical protein